MPFKDDFAGHAADYATTVLTIPKRCFNGWCSNVRVMTSPGMS